MKIVIVYSSRFGNGKKCVDCVEDLLKKKGQKVKVINAQASTPDKLPPADIYIFSGASEAFSLAVGIKNYLKALPAMEGQKYALMSTHRMKRAIGLNKMKKMLTRKKMVKIGSIDFQVTGEVEQGNGLPENYEDELKNFVTEIV